jgi:S-adenosylmethionine decarboxylase
MIVGTEWLIEASGCEIENLRDLDLLSALFQRLITELDLQLVGEVTWHRFPTPGGVTGFALLSESHLACHTYPEYGLATINLYCCRARPEWRWAEALRETLGATNVRVRTIERTVAEEGRTVAEEGLKLEDSPLLAVARQP